MTFPDTPSGRPGDPPERPGRAPAGARLTGPLLAALLMLPVLAAISVPAYARVGPRLAGMPFFYWYQFACIGLAAVCIAAALPVARRHARRSSRQRRPKETPR